MSTTANATTAANGTTGAQRTDIAGGVAAAVLGIDGSSDVVTQTSYTFSTTANQNMALGRTGYTTVTTLGALRINGATNGAMAASTTYNVVSLYTPPYGLANNVVAANVALNVDYRIYVAAAGSSVTIHADLYEYNDATGLVGAAKGQYTSASIATTVTGNRTSLTGVNFGNAAFTVAPGNRLKVMFQIVTGATGGQDVGLLFGATQSTTAGVTYITPTLAATTVTTPAAGPTVTFASVEPYALTLSWSTLAGAASYKIERGTSGTGPWTQVGQTTATGFTDATLAAGTTYWYRVRGASTTADGPYSSIVSQATQPTPNGVATWAGTYTTTGTTLTCSSCHGNPPGGNHPNLPNCSLCHFNYGDKPAGVGTQAVDAARHLNGTINIDADCVTCHSYPMGPRREVASEFAQAWSHKKSAAGAVTKWDCIVCHMEGDPTTGDRSAVHGDTVINLRDPDLGTNIKGVTFTAASGTNPGSYGPTATDLTFASFSRDLATRLEGAGADPSAATLEAIMINQCLKCHDANGADAYNAGKPLAAMATAGGLTRTFGKPFGTTITTTTNYNGGTGYTACAAGTNGCVVNVNDSFATTNSSYHPIRGKSNNWYARANRMKAPWNIARVAGAAPAYTAAEWGALMTCWDCHALPTDTTIKRTVTAHGGAATLRGNVWANPATLCTTCHIGLVGTGNGNHGTNSAFGTSSNTDSGMQTYVTNQCHYCHSSNQTRPARPIRGAGRPWLQRPAHDRDEDGSVERDLHGDPGAGQCEAVLVHPEHGDAPEPAAEVHRGQRLLAELHGTEHRFVQRRHGRATRRAARSSSRGKP